jgi:hypothetical protein
MIFINMNLDGITSMQKFEDPIQVAFEHNLIIEKDSNLNIVLRLAL